ncbi:mannitol dehydrogenase family protein [Azospirillum rugosum]|uniref:Fructuronate reductase n=1 Tax=Azospirillum rugosum TaxID=416170 RepID=A0ABS4SF50_9PROT|nr:mannitol dehydrogenase family protein [Azospirillum rugosum]MBP2290693.1 fructuronate reductase [Azospirillum rugosum]MDQ0525581.1 fructuronate reductase [Azospirillum rugosum]
MSTSSNPDGASARLNTARLAALPQTVQRPAYDRSKVTPGILHIGLGAFCRAHLAVYTDDAIAAGDTDWGIIGADPLSPAIRDALEPQDNLYTLLVRGADGDAPRVVGSFLEALVIPEEPERVLDRMLDPRVRIVTLTVTEKGYCQDAATGALDEAHPAIVADLAGTTAPRSVPGLLVEGLKRRCDAGMEPFTVLCCDNLPQNGKTVRRIVTRFAELRDPVLGRFIAERVAFPCTMVDRITPATRDEDKVAVAAALGCEDAWPVVTEPFRQWVIEDDFPLGRPRWEEVGALLVEDVHAYEVMKLRCLNGAHTALAYLGVVSGIETISDAMRDPQLPSVIRRLWDEDLIPTLPPIPGVDPARYTAALEERFRNPALRHRTIQISSDGSQKLPPRLLEAALEHVRGGRTPRFIALAVAAWMRFTLEETEKGAAYEIADPLAARLRAAVASAGRDATALAGTLFAIDDIFAPELVADAGFGLAVVAALDSLLTKGCRATLADMLG